MADTSTSRWPLLESIDSPADLRQLPRARLAELEVKGMPVEEETKPQNQGRISAPKAESPGVELDLRGKRAEDALDVLENYLERAYLAGLPWVRIIHGKGTGRMREAVRKALDRNDHISSWEEGRDGEGGAGVTVAKLALD